MTSESVVFPFSHDARVQLAGDFHVILGLRVSLEGSSTWNEPTSSNLWNHLSYSHRSNKCIWFQLEDTEVEDEPPVAETNDIDGVQCPVSREVMVFYMLTPGWCTPSHVTALKVAGRVVWHCLPLTPLLHLFLPLRLSSLSVSVSFGPVEEIWGNQGSCGRSLSLPRCTKKALRAEPKTLTAF